MTNRKELRNALHLGNLYDFIASEGYQFTKDELIEIIKELDFQVYSQYGEDACCDLENKVREEFEERGFFEE